MAIEKIAIRITEEIRIKLEAIVLSVCGVVSVACVIVGAKSEKLI